LPERIFFRIKESPEFLYTEYKLPHENFNEIKDRVNEIFCENPIFDENIEKTSKNPSKITSREIKNAMISENLGRNVTKEKIKNEGKNENFRIYVMGLGILLVAIIIFAYLKFIK